MSLINLLNKAKLENNAIPGVVIGLVTDNHDPAGIGRIKVNYPVNQANGINIESDWIPMTSFFAGNNRGAFFLPAINDQVLIVFAYGNVNMPYAIGALWSAADVPPVAKTQQQNISEIKTRNGNSIIFDDTENKNIITITDAKNNQIVIDASNETIAITANKNIAVTSKAGKVAVTAAQDVTVEVQGNVSIKAAQISLEATGNLILKGSMIDIN